MSKIISTEIIEVNSEEDISNIKNIYVRDSTKVRIKCAKCDKPIIIGLRYAKINYICNDCKKQKTILKNRERKLNKPKKEKHILTDDEKLIRNSNWKNTIIKKYGSMENFKKHQADIGKYNFNKLSDEEKLQRAKKLKDAFKLKYNVDNPMYIAEFKAKMVNNTDYAKRNEVTEANVLKKYGSKDDYNKMIQEKVKQYNIENYGVEYTFQRDDVKDKIKESCIERYGVENGGASELAQNKIKSKMLERFGVENAFQVEKFKEKSRKTCRERYGKEYYTQTPEYREKSKKKYTYNNITFDSSWELAFYIYNIDKNNNIKICNIIFEYCTNDGAKHFYYPDFIINDIIYEIKGQQLFDKDGNFGSLGKLDIDKNSKKLQIIKDNGIVLIGQKEIGVYLEYIKKTYGRNYLKRFRNK